MHCRQVGVQDIKFDTRKLSQQRHSIMPGSRKLTECMGNSLGMISTLHLPKALGEQPCSKIHVACSTGMQFVGGPISGQHLHADPPWVKSIIV